MPDNKKEKRSLLSRNKSINSLMDLIDQGMSELYKDTYFSTDQNKKELNTLGSNIDDTLNSIMSKRGNGFDTSNISRLIMKTKLSDLGKDEDLQKSIQDIFSDNKLLGQISSTHRYNTYIKEFNDQIDLICKYFPKLNETVKTKIDNILSADHFTKEFLSVHSDNVNGIDKTEVLEKIKKLRKIYNYDARAEIWLDHIIRYGEQFLYCVPYNKALERLLQIKNSDINEIALLNESFESFSNEQEPLKEYFSSGVKIELYKGGLLENFVEEHKNLDIVLESTVESVYESFINEADSSEEESSSKALANKKRYAYTKAVEDKFQFPGSTDGFINTTNKKEKKEEELNVPGAILQELEPHKVEPIYISNVCIGYYNIEIEQEEFVSQLSTKYNLTNISARNRGYTDRPTNMEYSDQFLGNLAKDISSYIDSNFINNNIDLKQEIYLMLKYSIDNSKQIKSIKVTFIPPEDMIHMYFNLDPKTHHGISELSNSIIPAMIYIGLYLSNTIGIMTRGQDKRVYYVKQNIETNIAKTMLNVVNQIKKNNFNYRTFNSINNVLDIAGKYNDYIVPLSKSGDAPIQFDIMPGQNITVNEDLYNLFEEQALNATDVTKEMIDARNSLDYAIQATMSNSKFLIKMLKKQALYIPFLDRSLCMLYRYEYNEKVNISVLLPAPQILNLNNVNQVINANNEYCRTLLESEPELATGTDQMKTIFLSKMTRYNLATHIPYDIVDKLIKESKIESSLIQQEE